MSKVYASNLTGAAKYLGVPNVQMRTLARAGRVTYVGRKTFISMHVAYHESIAAPAPASVAEDMPESKEEQHAVVTLRTEFLDVQAKHAVAPIAFRETQRDFKRYAAVIAATSVEDVKVGDGEAFRTCGFPASRLSDQGPFMLSPTGGCSL